MKINQKIKTILPLAALAGLALSVSAHAAVVFVVDAPADGTPVRGGLVTPVYGGNPVSSTFDLSTGGDSAAGLSGSLTVAATSGWYETGSVSENFNDDYTGEISGASDTATWTVTGYAPGATVNVYATWRNQSTFSTSSPYVINGGTAINVNHQNAPTADLTLNDPAGGTEGFQLLGAGTADGSGQVQVVLTKGTSWTPVDALAFSSAAVPEPTTTALLGLGGLALILRRRK